MKKINLAEKFALINRHWDPKIVGELNGQGVKLAKLKGEFIWHHHENEDELFFVVEGCLTIHFREQSVQLAQGELIIIPRGIEHKPEAENEVSVLMFEPLGTRNTGNVTSDRTLERPESI